MNTPNGTRIPLFETVTELHSFISAYNYGECPPAAMEFCVLSIEEFAYGWMCDLVDGQAVFDFPVVQAALETVESNVRETFVFRLFVFRHGFGGPRMDVRPGSLLYANPVNRMVPYRTGYQGVTTTEYVNYIQII